MIVAYKTAIKVGENQFLLIKTDEIEYKKTAEVYEFYLHDKSANGQSNAVMSSSLGTVTNTGKDNGYSGSNPLAVGVIIQREDMR